MLLPVQGVLRKKETLTRPSPLVARVANCIVVPPGGADAAITASNSCDVHVHAQPEKKRREK